MIGFEFHSVWGGGSCFVKINFSQGRGAAGRKNFGRAGTGGKSVDFPFFFGILDLRAGYPPAILDIPDPFSRKFRENMTGMFEYLTRVLVEY